MQTMRKAATVASVAMAAAVTIGVLTWLVPTLGGDLRTLGELPGPALLVTAAGLIAALVGVIALMSWLYTAQSNLRVLPDARPRWSPGWALGGWFIPLANFVIPALVLYDAARNSAPRAARRGVAALVLTWWLGYTGSAVIGVANRYAGPFDEIIFDVLYGVRVVGVVALAAVLYRVTGWQERRRAEPAPVEQLA
jgi:hypothetical protein